MGNEHSSLREFGRFRLDPKTRVLWFQDEPVNLPLKEIELLTVLTESAGQVVTKDEILDKVWAGSFVEESNLTRHVYLLRKMLKEHGEGDGLIQTVPRRGYRFTGHVTQIHPGDLVIEKHTSTRTLVEIDEGEPVSISATDDPSLTENRSSTKWRSILAAGVAIAMLIGMAIFLSPGTSQTSGGPSEIKSIAVLPVRSFSDASDDEELRLRITDALITRLGNMDRVAVRPTSAVLPFARSEEDILTIGRRLKVDAVVDGRIQREGDRLRVTLQLLRTSDGEHLWSEQFDGNAEQTLNLQDNIFAKVSNFLAAPEMRSGAPAKRLTENPEAYEAYLKGRYFWNKRDADSLQKAVENFRYATELDPQFSEAFAGLADAKYLKFNYNIDVRQELVDEAKRDLQRALQIKPDSPDALITLGTIAMGNDWDWKAAESSLQHAVSAAPNSAIAHMRYGALLMRMRRFDQAEAEFLRHLELDPLSISGIMNLGMVRFCKSDSEGAERQYRALLDMDEKQGAARWLLSRNMWLQGRNEEAVTEISRALELDGNSELAAKVTTAGKKSPLEAIRTLLYEWRDNPPGTNPHNLAYLSTYLNDNDKAIYWLGKSIEEHHPWTNWIAAAPEFQVLRSDERFIAMLRKLDLP
jgi:DNA-binding winged helix-turn-helix (wHTH) protein/TolB-like protein/cytochrome c-type biogenesis protein CcmH/NrfG